MHLQTCCFATEMDFVKNSYCYKAHLHYSEVRVVNYQKIRLIITSSRNYTLILYDFVFNKTERNGKHA